MRLPPACLFALILAAVRLKAAGMPPAQPEIMPGSAADRRALAVLAKMTLEEKIGQMTQPDFSALASPEQIKTYALGSVLSGGSTDPAAGNSPVAWADFIDACQDQAFASRLHIPLLYGIDAVHGHNNVLGAVIFPHNIGLGATRDPALVEQAARVTALEMTATGIHWAFAPGVIVGRDERWGRTYESFGEDPALVSELGAAAIHGLQTARLDGATAVLACAKHYLGDGGTLGGKDQGNTACDEPTLRRLFLPPYQSAVRAGVGSIMVSYSSWNGHKMHGNRYLITDVLKGELGFPGFVVSDWAAIDQLPGDYRADIEASINAGLDMVMIPRPLDKPNNYVEFITTLKELVQAGRVPQSRIDDAVRRILRVKFALDLAAHPRADRALLSEVGSPAHRAVARACVRESLVLLKNDRHTLPLAAGRHVHVVGCAANDLGLQCGGWTISWQGQSGPCTEGTTILEGLRQTAPAGTEVTFIMDGSSAAGADTIIVVTAEEPYAEGKGDRVDLSLPAADLKLLREAHATGAHVVHILICGRPLILGEALDLADATVVAWFPGSEGAGVADVLWGKFAPTGKLPVSWPRTMAQIPINVGDEHYDPLFPYGFGLTY
ncbi:MAG TPA: glycoside hydrolase family 3 N-terminal domain-containing protein [Opitutaceae bacterium]|jgi:beta-glucosidase|nr:glycoside hydrolase family 3 N-terminal domain-containing protein [Opitutaceae bacterium]